MSLFHTRRGIAAFSSGLIALAAPLAIGLSHASASSRDWDGDGMPNRWEINHHLNPRVANARGNADRDGLRNIAEFRNRTNPVDEDTDNDGMDDGDEVHDGYASTDVKDADTNDNGVLDGDQDADRDGVHNEDEDDATEACRDDDDDSDTDGVDNEDENDFGTSATDPDSDGDGIEDGNEDSDGDTEADEDEDDQGDDECSTSDEGEDDDDEQESSED